MFSDDTMVVAKRELATGDLDDSHVIILSLADGAYYGINSVGGRIWQLIQEALTVRDIQDRLMAEYEVDRERCRLEVVALLEQLELHKLIDIQAGKSTQLL